MTSNELDLAGLKCPLPVLKTRKALSALSPGDVLVVTATDPLATLDIPALLQETGDLLEEQESIGGKSIFTIRKR